MDEFAAIEMDQKFWKYVKAEFDCFESHGAFSIEAANFLADNEPEVHNSTIYYRGQING
jgi:hypothetical protein